MNRLINGPMASLALICALLPQPLLAQPAPPDLSQLPLPVAVPAPPVPASAPQRRCVAGCDGKSARVVWSEDAFNRFEEHRNERGELVKYFVHPKSGAPRYEVLLGVDRGRQPLGDFGGSNVTEQRRDGQSVWTIKSF
jgi:hypothetical protein